MSKYTFEEKTKIIVDFCLAETKSINPIQIAKDLMHHESVSIHGAEHHVLDGAAFLTAMHNAGVEFDLEKALKQEVVRGSKMPGAMCGLWGVCGSTASIGAALSIVNKTTYLSVDSWGEGISYSAKALSRMGEISGPRCCKRNAFTSILTAIDYVNEVYDIKLEKEIVECEFYSLNADCIKERCPYYKNYTGNLEFNK